MLFRLDLNLFYPYNCFNSIRRQPRGGKTMKKFLLALTLSALSSLLFVSLASAAGFALPEQGVSAMGMASAFVGQADDASAVWYNPAGITQLDGTRISGGIIPIYPILTHENTTGTTDVSERMIHVPIHLYATHKMSDKLSFGLGVNDPFGLATDWDPNNSATRYVATFSKVVTTEVNPNVAYKLNDNLSVAAGVAYVKLRATFESIFPTGFNLRISGDGDGWGGNAAVHYKATNQFNVGLSYRSRVKIDVDGTADYNAGVLSNAANTSVTLPDLLQVGASYKASDNLTLNADLGYTWWSTYDRLVIQSATFGPLVGSNTLTQEKQWKDTWTLRIGGQYKLSDQLKLRAGYLYDKNPVKEEYFETRIPDSDRQGVSVGAGYTVGNITIDAAYMYLYFNHRTINNSLADDATIVTPTALNGNYKSQAHLAGITVGYKF
jgi:long-chain fatty acid transport protein